MNISGNVEEVMEQIDDYDDIDVTNDHGNTPIHNAVRKGHTKVVKVLLENGADLSIKNVKGKTPIDLAYGSKFKNYEYKFTFYFDLLKFYFCFIQIKIKY